MREVILHCDTCGDEHILPECMTLCASYTYHYTCRTCVEALSNSHISMTIAATNAGVALETALADLAACRAEAIAWKEEAEDNEADAAAGELACVQRDKALADLAAAEQEHAAAHALLAVSTGEPLVEAAKRVAAERDKALADLDACNMACDAAEKQREEAMEAFRATQDSLIAALKYSEKITSQRDELAALLRLAARALADCYDKGVRGYYRGIGGQVLRTPTDLEMRIDMVISGVLASQDAAIAKLNKENDK